MDLHPPSRRFAGSTPGQTDPVIPRGPIPLAGRAQSPGSARARTLWKWKILGVAILTGVGFGLATARAQLFENLRALGGLRFAVGDPSVTLSNRYGELLDGPKDIVVADLDADRQADLVVSDKDGSVTVRYGLGDGHFGPASILRTWVESAPDAGVLSVTNVTSQVYCDYQPTNAQITCYTNIVIPPGSAVTNRFCYTNVVNGAVVCTNIVSYRPGDPRAATTNVFCLTNLQYGCVGLITNASTNIQSEVGPFGLRGVAVADFTGDGLRDIAVAAPGERVIHVFRNGPGRQFAASVRVPGWLGVRDLATGDFDGDGRADLLAGGTSEGVVQYRGLGGATFERQPPLVGLASDAPFGADFDFPQPAYYLKTFRYPGSARDEAVASFAQSGRIWSLRPNADGRLESVELMTSVALTSLEVGPILRPATNGAPPDLVTAYSRSGTLEIYPASESGTRFGSNSVQRLYVPGAPRNIRMVDLDLDGWNDLVVVAQAYDKVLIYHNDHGELSLATESFAGRFPREMDAADFNGDTFPDLAVLNRYSADVSILITSTNLTSPVGFVGADNLYPVDGQVSGLEIVDFNRDGRPDVMQLHRDTSEFSIRLGAPDGRLGTPSYYSITNASNPAAQKAIDLNGDGRPDLVSANLSGSITVRLGAADGTFGPEQTFELPIHQRGGLFALVPGDFDGDGKMDLAAGYLDCRVSFFRGDGTGQFTWIRTDLFTYEPRSMVAGDFDQDGDLDLVGGSLAGHFVVLENTGDWFTGRPLVRQEYRGPAQFDANLRLVEMNNDQDPDLLFGYPGGFAVFFGGPGLTFHGQAINLGGNNPRFGGNVFVLADLDGDGLDDLASLCAVDSCLTIFVRTNNQYLPAITVPVPVTRYLGTADFDGDGFADLVGSGDVLWVALSGRRSAQAAPPSPLAARGAVGVVLNEVLAANASVALEADSGRTSDFVEVYNGSTAAVNFFGWSLRLIRTNEVLAFVTNSAAEVAGALLVVTNRVLLTNDYTLSAGVTFPPGGHLVFVCTDRIRSLLHTGFNLPAEGGTLILRNREGVEVDRVAYSAMGSDQSYARYTDGARRFVVNNIPSPGAPNVDNGAVAPTLALAGVDLETEYNPRRRLQVRALARDDIGLVNVSLLWRRLDVQDNETKRVILFDDGINEDGPGDDGNYFGVLGEALPAGAEIQFYLECTDITGQVETSPGNPRFVSEGQPAQMHALAVGVAAPPLEISELVADNGRGLTDERGGHPGWVEIRNRSGGEVSMANVSIGPRFFGNSDRMSFTNLAALQAGEHVVVYADEKPNQGQLHAPFKLDPLGGDLYLIGVRPSGARYLIDQVRYGPQTRDVALSRLGPRGPLVFNEPTPRAGNVDGPWRAFRTASGLQLAFAGRLGATITVEAKTQWEGEDWTPIRSEMSLGLELVVPATDAPSRYFRVRVE